MKKRYWLIGTFAIFQLCAKAQDVEEKPLKKVKKTDIELVYSHYIQDGDNSAVTGGVGTEELKVYGPSMRIKSTSKQHVVSLQFGTDIISSASTDKIDWIPSSASRKDARTYINASYERQISPSNLTIYGGLGFSIESDYTSVATKLGITKSDEAELKTLSFQFQMFNDDLRWGRLNGNPEKPLQLIYPYELRDTEWFDEYKRNSYNFKFGWTQVVNQRNITGVYPEFTLQDGLLATPFHRVYFSNDSMVVENLPYKRYKGALALKWNTFLGGHFILKNTLNTYIDNFGIKAFAIENETAIKLNSFFTLLPNLRFYLQEGSRYFAPYKQHDANEKYYTSDYDLSDFQTYDAGLGIKLKPNNLNPEKTQLSALILRYNFIHRSNQLKAHAISLVLQTSKTNYKELK